MSTSDATTSSSESSATIYKGKITRSWPQLPPEVVRLIATHLLLQSSRTGHVPHAFKQPQHWQQRMLYDVLRNFNVLEKMYETCPQWGAALDYHLFYNHALTVMDPHNHLGHLAVVRVKSNSSSAATIRVAPARHFRQIYTNTCIVCRINHPTTSQGLSQCRRYHRPPSFYSYAGMCTEHWKRRLFFCGVCMRDSPPQEMGEYQYQQVHPSAVVAVHENEDEETWPGVHATCRACRGQALWNRVKDSADDVAAIGGPRLSGEMDWDFTGDVDWETALSRDAFLTWGDGAVEDVLTLARDKYWLRKHTKIRDLLEQLLESTAYEMEVTGQRPRRRATMTPEVGSNADYDDSDVSDDEVYGVEDEDGSHYREEAQIRPLALLDWARNRILDGHWLAPSEQLLISYGHIETDYAAGGKDEDFIVAARHPCPWFTDEEDTDENDTARGIAHPRISSVTLDLPSNTGLLRAVDGAFAQAMRTLLLPALKNLVRKLVQECSADAASTRAERAASLSSPQSSPVLPARTLPVKRLPTDPAVRAARLSLEDVMDQLREESTWIEGIDWVARREYRREDERREEASAKEKADEEMNDNHTESPPTSSSTASHSLPPDSDLPMAEGEAKSEEDATKVAEQEAMDEDAASITIAVDPVLENPRTMPAVPYIPISIAHLPEKSRRAIWEVWREACAPLYHCRCRICVRAQTVASGAEGSQTVQQNEQRLPERESQVAPLAPAAQIELLPMVALDGDDEMDDAELDSYLSSADEELEEVTVQEVEMEDRRTTVPRDAGDNASIDGEPIQEDDADNSPQRARKRSCDELEEQEALEGLPRKVRRAASQQVLQEGLHPKTNGHLDRPRSAEQLRYGKSPKSRTADAGKGARGGEAARDGGAESIRGGTDGGRLLSYEQVQIRVPIYSSRGVQEKDLVEYAR
ncbi:hypothetical protein K523DRAFT_419474 [Schizophyllum commune Tattone D]|nr:hypothetical protein K523DRAFT_419474 [Schizophyllum commune Tattone D]